MPTYKVYINQVVSACVEVEAESVEEALDTYWTSDDMPSGITVGAFGYGASVDESGDWTADEVVDMNGVTLWRDATGFTNLDNGST